MYKGRPYDRVLERMLLDRVAEGDKVAFTELFDHYQVMVYDYSMKLTRSKSQAEEIVQDIFIKIWLKRKDIQTIENFGAYLNRATRNQCYTALRKIAADALKYVELTAQDVLSGTNAEHRLLYNESAKMLKTVVDTLPPQQKLVYELCHEQGLKYQEVADQLNISSGTVHKHMKLALKTIRTHFIEMNAMLFVLISMNK